GSNPTTSMELYQLGYFIEIAHQKHFTRAAERLRMAQPALSQQMKNLEAELGAILFIRGKKETQLTAAGKALLPRAEALLAQAEAAKAAVSDVGHARGGRLVVAAIPSVCACLLPELLHSFGCAHPGVELQLIEDSSERIAECVESGKADLGFLQLPANKATFESRVLITEPFVLLLAASHALAGEKEVSLKQLAAESFIFYKGRARDSALEACRKAGFEPRIACESGELETVRSLVAARVGVAIVPQLAVSLLPKNVSAVSLKQPGLQRQIAAVWKKGGGLSPAGADLLEMAVKGK
ncbi:MAG: LysR family transcriptional regulator, partial [Prosthecobacter sp.]